MDKTNKLLSIALASVIILFSTMMYGEQIEAAPIKADIMLQTWDKPELKEKLYEESWFLADATSSRIAHPVSSLLFKLSDGNTDRAFEIIEEFRNADMIITPRN